MSSYEKATKIVTEQTLNETCLTALSFGVMISIKAYFEEKNPMPIRLTPNNATSRR